MDKPLKKSLKISILSTNNILCNLKIIKIISFEIISNLRPVMETLETYEMCFYFLSNLGSFKWTRDQNKVYSKAMFSQ